MEQEHNGIKYLFFWNGHFSNWHPSFFTVDSIRYNCGEQYMMHQKAVFFQDTETADKIMQTNSPKEQKALGRKDKNFNKEKWNSVCHELVKKGLREKFKQNKIFRDELLQYKDHQIVEASPYDRIWGIGYSASEAIANINNWGKNLLGKILTELANELE